jgi:hypothetical protein
MQDITTEDSNCSHLFVELFLCFTFHLTILHAK